MSARQWNLAWKEHQETQKKSQKPKKTLYKTLLIRSSSISRKKGMMETRFMKFSMYRLASAEKVLREPQLQQQNLRMEVTFTWKSESQLTLQSMLNQLRSQLPRLKAPQLHLNRAHHRHTNSSSTRPSPSTLTMRVAISGLKFSFPTWRDWQITQKRKSRSSLLDRGLSQWK